MVGLTGRLRAPFYSSVGTMKTEDQEIGRIAKHRSYIFEIAVIYILEDFCQIPDLYLIFAIVIYNCVYH